MFSQESNKDSKVEKAGTINVCKEKKTAMSMTQDSMTVNVPKSHPKFFYLQVWTNHWNWGDGEKHLKLET